VRRTSRISPTEFDSRIPFGDLRRPGPPHTATSAVKDERPEGGPPGSCGDRNTPSPELLLMRFSYRMVPEVYQLFWAAMARGEFISDAAVDAGTDRKQGTRWLVAAGGVRPRRGRGLKVLCLTLAQREEIALGRAGVSRPLDRGGDRMCTVDGVAGAPPICRPNGSRVLRSARSARGVTEYLSLPLLVPLPHDGQLDSSCGHSAAPPSVADHTLHFVSRRVSGTGRAVSGPACGPSQGVLDRRRRSASQGNEWTPGGIRTRINRATKISPPSAKVCTRR
jgi:hypothetical protein